MELYRSGQCIVKDQEGEVVSMPLYNRVESWKELEGLLVTLVWKYPCPGYAPFIDDNVAMLGGTASFTMNSACSKCFNKNTREEGAYRHPKCKRLLTGIAPFYRIAKCHNCSKAKRQFKKDMTRSKKRQKKEGSVQYKKTMKTKWKEITKAANAAQKKGVS